MNNEIKAVEIWAEDKGISSPENFPKQMMKVMEELGELNAGILKGKRDEEKDAFGDLMVTIIILAKQRGVSLEEELRNAYLVIRDRKGKVIDGSFVKEEGGSNG